MPRQSIARSSVTPSHDEKERKESRRKEKEKKSEKTSWLNASRRKDGRLHVRMISRFALYEQERFKWKENGDVDTREAAY